jgi:enterochelin esterase-like enzyme
MRTCKHALFAFLMFSAQHAWPAGNPLPHVAAGRIERLADMASRHVPPRNVDVWLPPHYPADAPYAVVYMHDGQMLFDAATTWNHQEWRADEVASALIARGEVRPFLIVGVWNAGAARISEYFPVKPWQALTAQEQARLYKQAPGEPPLLATAPYADAYLRFLVEELKPFIDRHYAVDTAASATFTLGSSLGGLVSMYALGEYPQVFGGAACLSTHWPGTSMHDDPDNPGPKVFQAYVASHFDVPADHRLYFDHGAGTLDAWYAERQDAVDGLLRNKGWDAAHLRSLTFPGAEHNEQAWAARLEQPLRFLLRAPTASKGAE